MAQEILRLPEVKQRTGLSRSAIYRLEGAGQFPSRVKLGPRSVGWVAAEIDEWIDEQIEKSRDKEVV